MQLSRMQVWQWMLSQLTQLCLSVLQRGHWPHRLLHCHQDWVPAAAGQGRGGYPGDCVPSPHRQVGVQSRRVPSLRAGLWEGCGRHAGMGIPREHGDCF